ncbi:hypothetical protein PR048_009714 [Dryococelus australis]|uniref:Uncharacterized protein n=1 Tax=Dryococelus australis TaxID=614101 RepID=A0ABQ9I0N2_9NEOP|nr:hypothetical protein PR048_009714 [Dryococelus australis]
MLARRYIYVTNIRRKTLTATARRAARRATASNRIPDYKKDPARSTVHQHVIMAVERKSILVNVAVSAALGGQAGSLQRVKLLCDVLDPAAVDQLMEAQRGAASGRTSSRQHPNLLGSGRRSEQYVHSRKTGSPLGTKSSCILNEMAPDVNDQVVKCVQDLLFSVSTDGSNDTDEKLYPIVVTFFDDVQGKVVSTILIIPNFGISYYYGTSLCDLPLFCVLGALGFGAECCMRRVASLRLSLGQSGKIDMCCLLLMAGGCYLPVLQLAAGCQPGMARLSVPSASRATLGTLLAPSWPDRCGWQPSPGLISRLCRPLAAVIGGPTGTGG